jgi:hypothetical protein
LGPNTKYNENKRAVENHPFGFSWKQRKASKENKLLVFQLQQNQPMC